jgi:sRNA-binding protein
MTGIVTERRRITGTLSLPGFKVKAPPPPPIPITALPEVSRQQRVAELIGVFATKWPAAFGQGAVKPLAIGIDAEIKAALAGEASSRLVSDVLKWWTSRGSYLEALSQPGARRCGLDGRDAGPVSDRDREIATQQLKEQRRR